MPNDGYVVIWQYDVRPEAVAEFERVYGPGGEWVALFREAPGYRWTRLLRDQELVGRYVTVDAWESAEAYQEFRRTRAAEFQALDVRCERLTVSETIVGHFEGLA